MAAVLAAPAAVVEEAREAAWEKGARVAVVVTVAERVEDGWVVVAAVGREEGVRVVVAAAGRAEGVRVAA